MDSVTLMAHTLSALTDSQKPKRPDPPYDRTMRITVEIDIDVPVWIDASDPDDAPSVTLGPVKDWTIFPDVAAKMEPYILETLTEEVIELEATRRRDDYERARDYEDGRGDYEYEARKDAYAMREGK